LAPYEHFHPWYGRGGFGGGTFASVNILNSYRNARVNGAVNGIAANAFSSGRFGAISRVSRADMAHVGLVRGGMPLKPTASNMRFSDRQTSVAPRAMNNTRFYSQQRAGGSGFSPGRTAASSGWGGFGSPNRSSAAQPNRAGAASTQGSSANWSRFGAPTANRQSMSSGYASRSYGQGSSQSVRVAPSIVHNRSYGAPGGSYGASAGQSYRQPGYSAPRTYSAPQSSQSSRGGGSRSAAPAARASSAPRSSSGGGHSSGGGGGHHR
jgi:hypothetical protein